MTETFKRAAPRDELMWFAERMERKLRENDHKGGWHMMQLRGLLVRLHQETSELARAVKDSRDTDRIVNEAADVANFAMMIAEQAMWHREEIEKGGNGQ